MGELPWKGIRPTCFDEFAELVKDNAEFYERERMENDILYKQIIPYIVFEYQDSYFLMQRKDDATEKRIANLYSLGIGGHIRQEDMEKDSIIQWAEREFHEEVSYTGGYTVETIGLVNDDFVSVGQYHVGLVMIFKADDNTVSIKSELQNGTLIPLEECMHFYKNMESWSQLVLDYLLDMKYGSLPLKKCCDS